MKTILSAAVLCLLPAFASANCLQNEIENNNTESDANGPLCSGQALQGSIANRRDTDWYFLDTDAAATINISLSHQSGDDFDWYFYPASGAYTASATTGNNPESGSASAPAAGRYYIKVTRHRGRGDYQLAVSGFGSGDTGGTGNCGYGDRPVKPGALSAMLVGSSNDRCVNTNNGDGGLLLMGGGADVDDAFVNRVAPKIQGGDVVVLRTSGTDAYNDYLLNLTQADSVETLIVDRRNLADDNYVEWAVRSAEFVWIAGGDQSDYLNQWADTKLAAAIDHVYQKGGVIGGTSAGNAVQSQHIYDPDGIPGIYSEEAVTDLCHEYINLSRDFLTTPLMAGVITDTHFAERDRLGRLMVFMAQLPTDTVGIGVDEATSIYFDASGEGQVDGDNAVYVLRENASTQRTQAQCGSPVIYENLQRYRLTRGDSYNLNTHSSSVGAKAIGIDGSDSDFYINRPYQ